MKHVRLERLVYSDDFTVGRVGSWYTMEDPWKDNARNISCIPEGAYVCVRDYFHRGDYPTFEITGVPDRSRILFHRGNTVVDVEGCVALGLRVGHLDGKVAVLDSATAFDEFMLSVRDLDEFILTVERA
jgi:hypothetical protein